MLEERDSLQERAVLDNSPPLNEMCATGVAETFCIVDDGRVFGTAKMNTEPRLTFMLPSMRSAFDDSEIVTQSAIPVSFDFIERSFIFSCENFTYWKTYFR